LKLEVMRTVIFTEGGRGIGLGHVTRCLSLAAAFEEKGADITLVVNGGEEASLVAPDAVLLNWLDEDSFRKFLSGADCAVIDSYLAPERYYLEAFRRVERCLFVDDFKRLDYPGGFVLNGGVSAKKLGYPQKPGVRYLLGPEYAPLRREFWDVGEKRIRQHIKRVLVTFGMSDLRNMAVSVVEALGREFPDVEKCVILGLNSQGRERLEDLKNVKVFEKISAEEMKELMLDCDVAISAGGQTTYELARVGLPSILVAVADNQVPNCKGWQEVGFALYAGRWDEIDARRIFKFLKLLEDPKVRVEMSGEGRKMVDGQGARRVADEVCRKVMG
jgi:spore coat polysaccharide biosynthesis predicted glycosyltransferase SpsG